MKKLNLYLTKILKDCPKGMPLYSQVHGKVTFAEVNAGTRNYPIEVKVIDKHSYKYITGFTADGRYACDCEDSECLLFPSRDCRDWSKFGKNEPEPEQKNEPVYKQLKENILYWFKHMAQIADDRKTANGVVMKDWAALDEIKVLATDSVYYIQKHFIPTRVMNTCSEHLTNLRRRNKL